MLAVKWRLPIDHRGQPAVQDLEIGSTNRHGLDFDECLREVGPRHRLVTGRRSPGANKAHAFIIAGI